MAAQTKTKSSRSSSSKTASRSRSNASRGKASGNARKSSTARRSPPRRTRSSPSTGPVESVRETVSSGAQSAGSAISSVASRAKTPLIAGGAALAGLAAGAVLTDRSGNRRKLTDRISLPRPNGPLRKGFNVDPEQIASAAKKVGTFGQQVSRVATEVQKARDEVKKSG